MKIKLKPLSLLMVLSLALTLTSCGSASKNASSDSSESMSVDASSLELNADSDSGKAGALKTVYFNFNSSVLTGATRTALENNAEFLKSNPDVQVQVEGHCDERGGVQYNLALGERRAKTVKNYLVSMGVASSRISTISFGKERPVSFGHSEDAWGQNRRGNFVITAK